VRSKARFVIVAGFAWVLAGCSSVPDALNPINWYRDVMGLSADDDLGDNDNDQNLKEGSKEPYPNLASVPAPPDTALSSIDRDKLVDSLVADRNNAKYSTEDLRAGRTGVAIPPPAATAANEATAAPAPSTAVAAPAPPVPTASATPTQPPARPGPIPRRGSAAPPAESPLVSPTVSHEPQGESATAAPPPPVMAAPGQVASATPRATAPRLRPPGAAGTEVSAPANGSPAERGPAVSYHAADVRFAPGSAALGDKLAGTIAEIVKLHNESGGTIRIIGHGEASGPDAGAAGFGLALGRAQAVAAALTNNGVAAKDIKVEAAPVAARGGTDVPRAEVYLEN